MNKSTEKNPDSLKVYLDTNIYLDYFFDRKDNFRPLGQFAFELLRRALNSEFKVIVSDWVIKEFCRFCDSDNIYELIKNLRSVNSLIFIKTKKEDRKKSRRYRNFPDALHAILAKKAEADFLVTRNLKDFSDFKDIVEVITPEML